MTQRVEFEGQTHEFPDDFSDKDVASALGQVGTENKVSQAIASVPKPPSLPQLGSLTKDARGTLRGPMASSISNVSDTSESGLETGNLVSENSKENQTNPIIPSMTDPTGRALGRSVNSAKNTILGAVSGTYHAFADKPQNEDEKTIANTDIGMHIPAPIKLAASRMATPAIHAAQDYAGGKVSVDDALQVAPEAIGEGAGNVIAGKLMDVAASGIPKLLRPAAENAANRAYNSILGTKTKGFNYGRNPGLGVADEGLMAWSKDSMLDKIRDRQAQTGKAIDLHLTDPAVNKPIVDIRAAINNPLNDMEAAAIKAKNLDLADRLADIRDRLNNDYARGTNGKLTPTGPTKLSGLTPSEANAIKQDVGEMTRWTGDPKADAASPAVKEVYKRINSQIEGAAPGIKAINKRYAELKDASESMDNKIRLGAKYNPLGSLSDILSAMEWGPVGYATTKLTRSTPGMSLIGQAARRVAAGPPEGVGATLGAAVAAPKEKK